MSYIPLLNLWADIKDIQVSECQIHKFKHYITESKVFNQPKSDSNLPLTQGDNQFWIETAVVEAESEVNMSFIYSITVYSRVFRAELTECYIWKKYNSSWESTFEWNDQNIWLVLISLYHGRINLYSSNVILTLLSWITSCMKYVLKWSLSKWNLAECRC